MVTLDEQFASAVRSGSWGAFPFGLANLWRDPSGPNAGNPVAVLGVYPSALHVGWRAPGEGPAISALAVDVEPEVFWPGADGASASAHLNSWRSAVDAASSHGSFEWSAMNGSSGRTLQEQVLDPLGLRVDDVFRTDLVPFFFVKDGKTEQGGAITDRYQPFADRLGLPESTLPARPADAALVRLACGAERGLAAELAAVQPRCIVTLGQAAADALAQVGDVVMRPAGLPLRAGSPYGLLGEIEVGGHRCGWLPLAHPGATRRGPWKETVTRWKPSLGKYA